MKSAEVPSVQGILLAGLHGWTESGIELFCCRPLLPVAGRPLVEYSLDWLGLAGAVKASVCANGSTGVFRRVLRDRHCGPEVDYYEDLMPRGTAGCILDASLATDADLLLVAEGTLLTSADPQRLLRAHVSSGAGLTVVVSSSGVSQSSPEPLGIYVASRKALQYIQESGYQDVKEMWIPALRQANVAVVAHLVGREAGLRVTGERSYLAANEAVLRQGAAARAWNPEYRRESETWIHESARIDPEAQLRGPVVVGPDCFIGPRARILGPATVGAGCWIGRDTIVVQSALWPGCRIGQGAIVDHSVLTACSNVEAGLVMRDRVHGPDGEAALMGCRSPELYWPSPWKIGGQAAVNTLLRGFSTNSGTDSLPQGALADGRARLLKLVTRVPSGC